MITISAMIQIFLAFCAGVSCLGAAAAYVAKAVGWLRKPEQNQNKKLEDHEERIVSLEKKVNGDYSEIQKLQKEMKLVLRGVVAIMKHDIDGNNTAEIIKIQGDIDDYLLEK